MPGGPGDAADGDSGNNYSFQAYFPTTIMSPGEVVMLWVWGNENGTPPGTTVYTLHDNHIPKLESTGDDLWLVHNNGLIADYAGWFDTGFPGTNPLEWSGAPPDYLGLCPTTPNCRRSADWDTEAIGNSWVRVGQDFVESASPTPGY